MILVKKNKIVEAEIVNNILTSASTISVVDKLLFICSVCGIEDSKGVGMFKGDFSKQNLTCKSCTRKIKLQEKYGVDNVSQLPNHKEKMIAKNREKYGADFYVQTKECIDRRKETCIEKYDVDVPSKSIVVKEAAKETCLKKYGATSAMGNKDIAKKSQDALKSKYGGGPLLAPGAQAKREATLIERYGEDYSYMFSSEKAKTVKDLKEHFDDLNMKLLTSLEDDFPLYKIKQNVEIQCHCGDVYTIIGYRNLYETKGCHKHYQSSVSKEEQEVIDFIVSLGFNADKYIMKDGKHIDIFIKEKMIGFEFDGLYWHSQKMLEKRGYNPILYHANKTWQAKEEDINLFHIFEDEWIYNKEQTKRKMASILGIRNEEKIFARKTIIKDIDVEKKKNFLIENHIQGNCPAIISIGSFYNNELVGVMTFSRPRGDTNEEAWELNRFATSKNVVGLASKMLSFFIKKYKPQSVISFSDKRWSVGNMYKQIGFTYFGSVAPSYWYITKKSERIHKTNFKKSLIEKKFDTFDSNKTEYENMINNGYDRIWDCGLDKWILKL